MSDIIKRLEDANGELLMVGNDFSDPLLDAAKEIKSMRKRVAELEENLSIALKESQKYYEELAALKQSHDKRVAWMWYEQGDEFNGYQGCVRFSQDRPSNMQAKSGMSELYTSPLKAGQGEPVAYLHKWKPHANTIGQSLHFVGVSPHGDDVEITPLCLCSTPTIPEG